MMTTIEGVLRDGRIELLENPTALEGSRVLVTFLPGDEFTDLEALGISRQEAAEARWRLGAFAADWDRPEMDVYDDM